MITNDNNIRAILSKPLGTQVQAHGWIKTRRDSKAVHFIQLNDGSTFQDLQVVIESAAIPEEAIAAATTGACVRVTGELIETDEHALDHYRIVTPVDYTHLLAGQPFR